jgi:hypothetical protein
MRANVRRVKSLPLLESTDSRTFTFAARTMKRSPLTPIRIALSLAAAFCASAHAADAAAPASSGNVETLIFVRHAEKPPEGLGQLNCKGLNRALALPAVIAAKYGKPDAIYAPSPAELKDDGGKPYYYVRPLATIEPTAIQFGMPVQTPYGYSKIGDLGTALLDAQWHDRTVLVAWEHREIQEYVQSLVRSFGGNTRDVPRWDSDDFDSIYVVRLDWSSTPPVVHFAHDHEGLNGRAEDCPCAGLPAAPAQ